MVPLVSVIIPTYNRAGLVAEAVTSVEAHPCPVHQALSGKISFNCTSA